MHTPRFEDVEQPPPSDERRAVLIATATLVQRWVHAQRATWTDVTPTSSGAFTSRPQAGARVLTPVAQLPTLFVATPETVSAPIEALAPPAPASPGPEEHRWPTGVDERVSTPSSWSPSQHEAPVEPAPVEEAPVVEPLPADPVRARIVWPAFDWWPKAAAATVALLLLGGSAWGVRAVWSKWQASPRTGTAVMESVPDQATVVVDGSEVGTTPLTQELAAGTHVIEFRRGTAVRRFDVDVVKGQASTTRVDWNVRMMGSLKIESTPEGARVSIDGKPHGVTPLTVSDLPSGNHAVVLESAEGTVRRTVSIIEGQTAQLTEAIFSGFLHVSSSIELEISEAGRRVNLNERNQILLSPGSHSIRFANRGLGFNETRRVEIKPGELATISIEPAMSSLSMTATVPAEVFIDGERAGETPLVAHPIRVGTRDIVVKSAQGERRITRTVTTDPVQIDVDFATP